MKAFIILFLFFLIVRAESTPQLPDTIEFNGQVFKIWPRMGPLQQYLAQNPDKTPKEFALDRNPLWRSNLTRGHIAQYRIAGGKIWLVSVEVPIRRDEYDLTKDRMVTLDEFGFFARFPLGSIFGNGEPAVHAQWFNGDLLLTHDTINPALIRNGTLSRKHTRLSFEKGVLVKTRLAEQDATDHPASASKAQHQHKGSGDSEGRSKKRPQ